MFSFTFDKFRSKFQKAHDELSDCRREVIKEDIVDSLWYVIQQQDIMVHVSTIKVPYQRNPRDYKLIPQDIASEIATLKKVSFGKGARNVSPVCTSTGHSPATGA